MLRVIPPDKNEGGVERFELLGVSMANSGDWE